MMIMDLKKNVDDSIQIKQLIKSDSQLLNIISSVVDEMVKCFSEDKKVLFCGNGGSAADAQHIAAELSGKYYFDRRPLPAEALHGNVSYITAAANDYGFDAVYDRYVQALGRKGDMLVAISTSGNSSNILNAIQRANQIGMKTVAFTGASGGKLKESVHYLINVPSEDTPRIQENHIFIGHLICEYVEKRLFG